MLCITRVNPYNHIVVYKHSQFIHLNIGELVGIKLNIYKCIYTREEDSSLHNSKHTKHTNVIRVRNTPLYSNGTVHIKQHHSKGVQPNAPPPAQTISVALDMSKAFETVNIHALIRKLLQTKIPGTIIKLIVNHIKGRKAYTTYINHTSSQRHTKSR